MERESIDFSKKEEPSIDLALNIIKAAPIINWEVRIGDDWELVDGRATYGVSLRNNHIEGEPRFLADRYVDTGELCGEVSIFIGDGIQYTDPRLAVLYEDIFCRSQFCKLVKDSGLSLESKDYIRLELEGLPNLRTNKEI